MPVAILLGTNPRNAAEMTRGDLMKILGHVIDYTLALTALLVLMPPTIHHFTGGKVEGSQAFSCTKYSQDCSLLVPALANFGGQLIEVTILASLTPHLQQAHSIAPAML